jgi:hypothetical protein
MFVRPEFTVHMLDDAGLSKAVKLAEAFTMLLDTVESVLECGREHSIVVTKLQEACFFAKRGIALQAQR